MMNPLMTDNLTFSEPYSLSGYYTDKDGISYIRINVSPIFLIYEDATSRWTYMFEAYDTIEKGPYIYIYFYNAIVDRDYEIVKFDDNLVTIPSKDSKNLRQMTDVEMSKFISYLNEYK